MRNQEIRIKGKRILVPSIKIEEREVLAKGRWLKTAIVRDEELVEGELVPDPNSFIQKLKSSRLKADIFTFAADVDDGTPKCPFYFEWDNSAVVSTKNYDAWWDGLAQESRKNVRRASKRGVIVKVAKFDDEFLTGMKRIFDESPLRQGRRFWHYGKDIETLRTEFGTYLDRSEWIGAYYEGRLIGFMKWTYANKLAAIMQILSLNTHYDKRPMNAMVAKAVEICQQKGMRYLVYSKYTYGKKSDSSLAEFKRRMGFKQVNFPRYYVPLTFKGKVALKLGAHRGLMEVFPSWLIKFLLAVRSSWLTRQAQRSGDGIIRVPEQNQGRTNIAAEVPTEI